MIGIAAENKAVLGFKKAQIVTPPLRENTVSVCAPFTCNQDLFPGIKRQMIPAVGTKASRFHATAGRLFFAVFILIGSIRLDAQTNSLPATSSTNNAVVMIQGSVEVARTDREGWSTGVMNEVLYSGDHVRTGERSRALVHLAGGTTIKLDELTEVEIPPPKEKTFLQGLFEIFHRNRNKQIEFRLPGATAAIRGTDFMVKVDTNGNAELTMLDGSVTLQSGTNEMTLTNNQRGIIGADGALSSTPVLEPVNNLIQWSLYYPGVINVDELEFPNDERERLKDSLSAYRAGDLMSALKLFPWQESFSSDACRVYQAALLLSVGRVDSAENILAGKADSSQARALSQMIAVTRGMVWDGTNQLQSASEWLAESYARQATNNIEGALEAARSATSQAPDFGFAWERVAELEFSSGRRDKALTALDRALEISPHNAQALSLKGFLLAAQNRIALALPWFDRAIAADSALANAWLGRGLCDIRQGNSDAGRRDLLIAASLEPQRSLLRSYLGKALADAGDDQRASHEFTLAEALDSNDPTPRLYSALLEKSRNQINDAVDDLEKSIEKNDNRAVYRSRLLLDEDLAVRNANLAAIYNDAGMTEVSVNEASKSVMHDYANYSAHLFLANSYNELRDPNLINLRYETATFNEYLLANLLAPVGGTPLSSYVSQQDYSRLFALEGPHFSSDTAYSSRGDWLQQASLYGWQKNTGYAVDVYYRSQNGERINNDINQWAVSAELKQQLTPNDSAYVEADFNHLDSGDVRQLYDQNSADPGLRVTDHQIPNLFLGYHHDWSPGVHTLVLGGRLEDNFSLSDTNISLIPSVVRDGAGTITNTVDGIFGPGSANMNQLRFRSEFQAFSVEVQQIAELRRHTLIGGARFQSGTVDTRSEEVKTNSVFYAFGTPSMNSGFSIQDVSGNLTRWNIYGYDQWQMFDPFWLTAGLSYDRLHYPLNANESPVSAKEQTTSQFSPKAGFVWTPTDGTTFRGAYTRSLGGLFYDGSVRLEPVQVAGFVQAYRSLIPESVEGSIAGSKFQTFDLAWEQKFKTRTYLTLQLELLQSKASQDIGAFDFDLFSGLAVPTQLAENLKYQEESLVFSLNQLVGDYLVFGAHYRVSEADLKVDFPSQLQTVFPNMHHGALLHMLDLDAIFNHPSGFFAEAQALWRGQSNFDDDSNLAGDNFWQFNLYSGYRFAHRRMELTAGLLNLTGQNYRLNPLNLYQELPRERTLEVSLTMNF